MHAISTVSLFIRVMACLRCLTAQQWECKRQTAGGGRTESACKQECVRAKQDRCPTKCCKKTTGKCYNTINPNSLLSWRTTTNNLMMVQFQNAYIRAAIRPQSVSSVRVCWCKYIKRGWHPDKLNSKGSDNGCRLV